MDHVESNNEMMDSTTIVETCPSTTYYVTTEFNDRIAEVESECFSTADLIFHCASETIYLESNEEMAGIVEQCLSTAEESFQGSDSLSINGVDSECISAAGITCSSEADHLNKDEMPVGGGFQESTEPENLNINGVVDSDGLSAIDNTLRGARGGDKITDDVDEMLGIVEECLSTTEGSFQEPTEAHNINTNDRVDPDGDGDSTFLYPEETDQLEGNDEMIDSNSIVEKCDLITNVSVQEPVKYDNINAVVSSKYPSIRDATFHCAENTDHLENDEGMFGSIGFVEKSFSLSEDNIQESETLNFISAVNSTDDVAIQYTADSEEDDELIGSDAIFEKCPTTNQNFQASTDAESGSSKTNGDCECLSSSVNCHRSTEDNNLECDNGTICQDWIVETCTSTTNEDTSECGNTNTSDTIPVVETNCLPGTDPTLPSVTKTDPLCSNNEIIDCSGIFSTTDVRFQETAEPGMPNISNSECVSTKDATFHCAMETDNLANGDKIRDSNNFTEKCLSVRNIQDIVENGTPDNNDPAEESECVSTTDVTFHSDAEADLIESDVEVMDCNRISESCLPTIDVEDESDVTIINDSECLTTADNAFQCDTETESGDEMMDQNRIPENWLSSTSDVYFQDRVESDTVSVTTIDIAENDPAESENEMMDDSWNTENCLSATDASFQVFNSINVNLDSFSQVDVDRRVMEGQLNENDCIVIKKEFDEDNQPNQYNYNSSVLDAVCIKQEPDTDPLENDQQMVNCAVVKQENITDFQLLDDNNWNDNGYRRVVKTEFHENVPNNYNGNLFGGVHIKQEPLENYEGLVSTSEFHNDGFADEHLQGQQNGWIENDYNAVVKSELGENQPYFYNPTLDVKNEQKKVVTKRRNTNPFHCDFCSKRFPTRSRLTYHLFTPYKKPVECKVCWKLFPNRCHLKSHMLSHTEDKKIIFPSAQAYTNSTQPIGKSNSYTAKGKINNFKCIACGKDFGTKPALTRHLAFHARVSEGCDVCAKVFHPAETLLNHLRAHNGGELLMCDKCQQCFGDKNNLKAHQKEHKVKCVVCCEYFTDIDTLSKHVSRSHHNGKSAVTCKFCQISFDHTIQLNDHNESSHVICDICRKYFADIDTMAEHCLRAHKKIKSAITCAFCKISCDNAIHLANHYESSHVKCDICSKYFADIDSLGIHGLRAHNKSKSAIKCKFCKTSFDYTIHLTSHYKSSHAKCDVCFKYFADIDSLTNHGIQAHNKSKSALTCDLCQISFDNLTNHYESSHIKCSICCKYFADKDSLIEHAKNHVKCTVCSQDFPNRVMMLNHMGNAHNIGNTYKCSVCQMSFFDGNGLIDHCKLQHVACTVCSKYFPDRDNMLKHVRCVHRVCNICKVSFVGEQGFRNHCKLHHVKCFACSKYFPEQESMFDHFKQFHSGGQVLSCDVCKELFVDDLQNHCKIYHVKCTVCCKYLSDEDSLSKHIKEGHNGGKPRTCNLCQMSFVDDVDLKDHCEAHHVKCTVCYKYFSNEESLTQHIKQAHNSDKTITSSSCPEDSVLSSHVRCIICFKFYVDEEGLLEHVKRTHDNGKPMMCDLCRKAFVDYVNLKNHCKLQHVTCAICCKNFIDQVSLSEHVQLAHNSDKTHTCDLCLISFVDAMSLTNHNKSSHVSCIVCLKYFVDQGCLFRHYKEVHNSGLTLACETCQTCFTDDVKLKAHRAIPHVKCILCKKVLAGQTSLLNHLQEAHPNRIEVKRLK